MDFGAAVKAELAGREAAPVQDRVVPAGYSPTGQYAGKACSTALFTKFLSYEGLLCSPGCRPSLLLYLFLEASFRTLVSGLQLLSVVV